MLTVAVMALSIISFSHTNLMANANQGQTSIKNATEISKNIQNYLLEFSAFKTRFAGSDGEKQASEYIFNKLSSFSKLTPKSCNGLNDKDGVQNFNFKSVIDGSQKYSQNIIFEYKSEKENAQKIIIASSYDAYEIKQDNKSVETEAINGSAGSVAVLLALAETLSEQKFDFDIEFIFFGAGESNNAGAVHYTNGLSKEDSKNILLMMNIENIALGKNLYFYIDETKTELSSFAKNLSDSKKLHANEVNISNLGKILLSSPSELGLNYKHIANSSSNEKFMKAGVLSMNIFSGDYSDGLVVGKCEYQNSEPVTNTKNDNFEYISNKFGGNIIIDNLTKSFNFINQLLVEDGLSTACQNSVKQINNFYSVIANQKLPLYLTISVLFVGIIIALIIYYKLSIKAYNSNVESEFISSVMSISDNFEAGQDKVEVSKIVGQIVAHDIKKDKRIKRKKDDNKNKNG